MIRRISATGGGPQRPSGAGFFPLHLEGRAAWWVLKNSFTRRGFRPYVVADFGLAEVDAKVSVATYADRPSYTSGENTDYDAWKKSGNVFVGGGLGTVLAFTGASGILLEAKWMQMLITPGHALALQIGYTVGL